MAHLIRKTKRLTVRPLTDSDYEAWKTTWLATAPAMNQWDRSPKSDAEVKRVAYRKILSSQKRLRSKDQFFDLAVFENSNGALVGTVAIMDLLRGLAQSAFLGYAINNRYWGQGFGKEAVAAAIDIAFRDLKLHRIEAGIEPTNRPSILLAKKIGLRKEGLKKRAVFIRDQWVDLAMYSATCEEFGIKWKGVTQTRPR